MKEEKEIGMMGRTCSIKITVVSNIILTSRSVGFLLHSCLRESFESLFYCSLWCEMMSKIGLITVKTGSSLKSNSDSISDMNVASVSQQVKQEMKAHHCVLKTFR